MVKENDLNLDPISKEPGAHPVGTGVGAAMGGAAGEAAGAYGGPVADADADNDDVIETLNDLLEACRDGEYGFHECAEHSKAPDIKTLLARHADECRAAGLELQTLIRQLGGKAEEGGSVSGALHRGWVSVRGKLTGYSDQAMLNECERGEDTAVARYRKALKQNLPLAIKTVVERQAQGAQRNHDQIKALRDTLKASR